jgi:hypothetical protein
MGILRFPESVAAKKTGGIFTILPFTILTMRWII